MRDEERWSDQVRKITMVCRKSDWAGQDVKLTYDRRQSDDYYPTIENFEIFDDQRGLNNDPTNRKIQSNRPGG
jgi:hypothetical protein